MAGIIIEDCKTPKEAWVLVNRLFGTIVMSLRSAVMVKGPGWEDAVETATVKLHDLLQKIVMMMVDHGYVESLRFGQLWGAISAKGLNSINAIEYILAVYSDLLSQYMEESGVKDVSE